MLSSTRLNQGGEAREWLGSHIISHYYTRDEAVAQRNTTHTAKALMKLHAAAVAQRGYGKGLNETNTIDNELQLA